MAEQQRGEFSEPPPPPPPATTSSPNCASKLLRCFRNRQSGDDLAELERKLRQAYVAKELQAQLMEKEAELFVSSVRERHAEKQRMLLMDRVASEQDLRERNRKREESEEYRRELAAQVKRKEERKLATAEESRREREMLGELDEIRESLDRRRKLALKIELIESLRRQSLIFQEIKLIRREEALEAEARLDLENEEYLRKLENREWEARKLREAKARSRERAVCKIAELLVTLQNEREEREELLERIIAEEARFAVLCEEEEERERRARAREELAGDLKEQMKLAEVCKLRFVEEDRRFAEQVMGKIAEDERTEMLTAQARRRMRAKYREDLVRLMEIRGKIREQQAMKREEERREEERSREAELERVWEERSRLLKRHAGNVARFVDRSALREQEKKIVDEFL